MANVKYKTPGTVNLTVKFFVFLILAFMTISYMLYTIEYVAEENGYGNDKAWLTDGCNRYYYEGEYGELYDYLILYDLYGDEDFALYWEIVDGYLDYRHYEMWSKVTEEQVAGSKEKAAEYKEKVQDNVMNCKYPQNKAKLQEYADMCAK